MSLTSDTLDPGLAKVRHSVCCLHQVQSIIEVRINIIMWNASHVLKPEVRLRRSLVLLNSRFVSVNSVLASGFSRKVHLGHKFEMLCSCLKHSYVSFKFNSVFSHINQRVPLVYCELRYGRSFGSYTSSSMFSSTRLSRFVSISIRFLFEFLSFLQIQLQPRPQLRQLFSERGSHLLRTFEALLS
jgi:hypothetical protein